MSRPEEPAAGTVFVWSMGGIRSRSEERLPVPAKKRRRGATKTPVFDSRRYPRLDLRLPIQYRVLGESRSHVPEPVRPFLLAQSRDVSPLGLCLALDEPLASGSILALNVHLVEERERFEAVARVVWCRPAQGEARHLVGLQFVVVVGDKVVEDRHARMDAFLRTLEA